jgi:hypothetical protein
VTFKCYGDCKEISSLVWSGDMDSRCYSTFYDMLFTLEGIIESIVAYDYRIVVRQYYFYEMLTAVWNNCSSDLISQQGQYGCTNTVEDKYSSQFIQTQTPGICDVDHIETTKISKFPSLLMVIGMFSGNLRMFSEAALE